MRRMFSRHLQARGFFFLVLTSLFAFAIKSHASCCSSNASSGIPRLMAHERALIEIATGGRYVFGAFDSESSFRSGQPSHLPHIKAEHEIQAMVRLFPYFEPFVRIPVLVQTSKKRTGSGLADISIGARIPVLKENFFYGWPGLSLFGSVKLPTGTSTASRQEDITSTGVTIINFGLMMEKDIYGLTYGLAYSVSLDSDNFTRKMIQPGSAHGLAFSLSHAVHDGGQMIWTLLGNFHARDVVNKKSIEDSDRRKLSLGVGYNFGVHSHIKLNTQITSDLPIPYCGKNFNNEVMVRIGLRFGVF